MKEKGGAVLPDAASARPRQWSSRSPLRSPAAFARGMVADLLAARPLAWRLLVRDVRAQYRQSFLGILWALVPPVVAAVGFTLASRSGVVQVGETELPYPAYVMFSMTLWQTFAEALAAPLAAITNARPMLTRIDFPREAILLSKLGELGFNFLIKLLLIAGLFVWYDMPVTPWALLAPFGLLALVALGMALGALLGCVGALYEDVSKALPFVTMVWLLLTPVVYAPPSEGLFAQAVRLNPVTPLLVTTRELATTGAISMPGELAFATIFTAVLALLAWVTFRIAMPFVIERASA